MNMNRRQALRTAAALAAGLPLLGCESIYSRLSRELGEKIPDSITASSLAEVDPAFHLFSRAAYGPWPGDLEKVQTMGAESWIDRQLAPEKIDDLACDLRARRFETIHIPPGACYDFKKTSLRQDMVRHTLLRAIYSRRQLLEVMVEFWSDHLNISLDKGDCIYLKAADDRLVVRKHALGKFRDLIYDSSISPAMLVYLDGKENRKSGPAGVPNENYGRELLELHTLGVHGGYTQEDVYEVARCLTGWRLHDKSGRGQVYFDAACHDDGQKQVLGHTIAAGGGAADRDRLIDIVCNHPSTAHYIASKLAARFVARPSQSFIQGLADKFTATGGDIKSLLKTILLSPEFKSDRTGKFKRPFHFIVSALRALAADTHAHADLQEYLQRMGQALFQYPTPDGYPDDASFWLGTLLWRWKFALAVASGEIKSVHVDLDALLKSLSIKQKGDQELKRFFSYFCGRLPDAQEFQALSGFLAAADTSRPDCRAELAGLILSSPAFQRY
jgi:uncharacterized protein (DUF1800 family)